MSKTDMLRSEAHEHLRRAADVKSRLRPVRDPSLPTAQGLYDPAAEKDACGVGFIADMKNRRSHAIVEKGLQILLNLDHRGASLARPISRSQMLTSMARRCLPLSTMRCRWPLPLAIGRARRRHDAGLGAELLQRPASTALAARVYDARTVRISEGQPS